MIRSRSPPSLALRRCQKGLLFGGGGGVAHVSVRPVTGPDKGGAVVLEANSLGIFRKPGWRPEASPGRSGTTPVNSLYVGRVRSADLAAPPVPDPLLDFTPQPVRVVLTATPAIPAAPRKLRERGLRTSMDMRVLSRWNEVVERDKSGQQSASALDGAGDDALVEVPLEERVHEDDGHEGDHDHGHLQRLRWRELLDAQLRSSGSVVQSSRCQEGPSMPSRTSRRCVNR